MSSWIASGDWRHSSDLVFACLLLNANILWKVAHWLAGFNSLHLYPLQWLLFSLHHHQWLVLLICELARWNSLPLLPDNYTALLMQARSSLSSINYFILQRRLQESSSNCCRHLHLNDPILVIIRNRVINYQMKNSEEVWMLLSKICFLLVFNVSFLLRIHTFPSPSDTPLFQERSLGP